MRNEGGEIISVSTGISKASCFYLLFTFTVMHEVKER